MRKIGIGEVALFFGYAFLFYVARELSVSHWLLSSGLRFSALLFLPFEYWPVILAACQGQKYIPNVESQDTVWCRESK